MLKLYNTRTRSIEEFRPLKDNDVGLYTCGPTVYNYAHVGNLRTYVFEDVLKRILKHIGYKVTHVMNITDVGHLTDDADNGEDKMEKGSLREGKTAWKIAEYYTEAFKKDMQDLNILEPHIWCKATDHIAEQIKMVETLQTKGFTYETGDGIYFDTTKVEDYGSLARLREQDLQAGSRVEMGEKRNPHDFALWKFTRAGENRQMEWDAFGKKGFPGWHLECSAMAIKYLGEQFDMHCGGVDHIPVHHINEIAQSESYTGKKPWVNFWVHGEFLLMGENKMAKSGNNFITLQTLKDEGIHPLAYRYFLLQAHYRKQVALSFKALEAGQQGLKRLRQKIALIDPNKPTDPHVEQEFFNAVYNDLNTAQALAILQDALKEERVSVDSVIAFDKVLGLDLRNHHEPLTEIPADVQVLLDERASARALKDWAKSDRIRNEILNHGFVVEDSNDGQHIEPA
ncbi:MAG: cysteine--tRNA ligase [Candidatus Magasanikbacteria bacterium CG10_big_fil_rev_8_21_14_0_10_43_6]|uniref:Cysteine--tRNA ligase n=1 Tax=Candidatus Magasanikbacteria bacterium CG10_big_fil_rev_8_21_14_0_10_43_6 TaxID=1974650 RepID=A0A2M6W094_9BACT|nr:MAG: cysteine--tRNA ligase [Candidatus Magasanikbacteria bacterium CG10_big_fil_rev_8_21_14_0_10_43_6]